MKIKINKHTPSIKFPCLLIENRTEDILLAYDITDDRDGYIGTKLSGTNIGVYSKKWDESQFTYYDGEIVLSNQ